MCDCEQRIDALESTVEELTETVQDQREEIADLKAEQESYPPLSIRKGCDSEEDGDVLFENLLLKDFPLGTHLKNKASGYDLEQVEERVTDLEDDAVTETVEVDRDEMLPIERYTHDRQQGDHDLSGNKLRATYVFEEFQKHATRESGLLKLPSSQVKNIHREYDLDQNPNTIRRTMKMVAKHSAKLPSDERDEKSPENLIKFAEATSRNMLVANQEEWKEHMSGGDESAEDESEDITDETADEWAAYEQAEPVTHPSDDRVVTDGGNNSNQEVN